MASGVKFEDGFRMLATYLCVTTLGMASYLEERYGVDLAKQLALTAIGVSANFTGMGKCLTQLTFVGFLTNVFNKSTELKWSATSSKTGRVSSDPSWQALNPTWQDFQRTMAGSALFSESPSLPLAQLCVAILGISSYVEGQYGVGDSCVDHESNMTGTCGFLDDCPSARKHIAEQYPELCGYMGTKPIVCCTQPLELRMPRAVGEMSERKCKDYAKMVYYKKRRPTLSFGVDKKAQVLADCRIVAKPLIIGGEKAKEGEFPHMAALGYKTNAGRFEWVCGGSLISENFVLSAAHCVSGGNEIPSIVRVGVTNINDDHYRQEFVIAEMKPHPAYKPPLYYNDLALVKLHRPIRPNPLVRPACLDTRYHLKLHAVATGWGKTHFSDGRSKHLLKVTLELISRDECQSFYETEQKLPRGIEENNQICAKSNSANFGDTCSGDSGGPLQVSNFKHNDTKCTYSIIGVTDFGKPCGYISSPGIYTSVRPHLKWIEDTIWPEEH